MTKNHAPIQTYQNIHYSKQYKRVYKLLNYEKSSGNATGIEGIHFIEQISNLQHVLRSHKFLY